MKRPAESSPKLSPAGESALLVEFSEILDLAVNQKVYQLDFWMGESNLTGVTHWVPGFSSLLIHFDPLLIDMDCVRNWFMERWESCPTTLFGEPTQVQIPVRYGGEDGPDLVQVAKIHSLSVTDIIRLHTKPVYKVGMMGFSPGFAYLMGLNPDLVTPRLANPRIHVPAGSVGIAGCQTGIYPLESPGGWQLIGRTDLTLYDPENEPHFLLTPGDEVRFVIAEGSAVR